MSLYNSTLKPSKKPLSRKTALKSGSPLKRSGVLARGASQFKKTRMKAAKPKRSAIRSSAKGEECTLRFPDICNYDPATTVLCHRNGAGMGTKAEDTDAAYGCYACHMVFDGQHPRPAAFSRELMLSLFNDAVAQTNRILKRKQLMCDDSEVVA